MKKLLISVFSLVLSLAVLCSCSGKKSDDSGKKPDSSEQETVAKVNEAFFEWDENKIIALTDEGAKQTHIIIPARCEALSSAVFISASKLKKVTFEDDDDIYLDGAFMNSSSITTVELPDNLTEIPSMCFSNCDSLKKIEIPSTVNSLGEYAFNSCDSLTSAVYGGESITVIPKYCFENCKKLKSFVIPAGVTSIEEYAFANCEALESITFSATIKKFAKFAFSKIATREIEFPAEMQIDIMDTSAFGMNVFETVVYVGSGSWCETNKDSWDIGFKEIKAK